MEQSWREFGIATATLLGIYKHPQLVILVQAINLVFVVILAIR